jgi:ABC-2 type transport system ATP-binding protein
MIEVKNLVKNYGSFTAVDNITFNVNRGEILGFLGPNAAGKTTTMRVITGFMPPSEGSVTVGGFNVFEKPLEVKRRIGYLPENPPLYVDMKVVEYLNFVASLKGVDKADINHDVSEVCEKVAISNVSNKVIKTLSKGFRQRVGLAQALIHNPEVLILDEPTIGLDPIQILRW